jgi:hypothetical protein
VECIRETVSARNNVFAGVAPRYPQQCNDNCELFDWHEVGFQNYFLSFRREGEIDEILN